MAVVKENKPTAEVLMFSMRAMGYSFEAAVADVIDNSISAGASLIEVGFPYSSNDCFVTISDNGCGMSSTDLFDAMKYGSQKKMSHRSDEDLGRFGLGLKSASLSQCRKLTVISKKNEKLSAMMWDLDVVEKNQNWSLLVLNQKEIKKLRNIHWFDDKPSGTVVIWENFDLIQKDIGEAGI